MVGDGGMSDDGDMTDTTNPRSTRPPLQRSKEDRIFAGVAGGLGAYLGTNPWLFRFAFIVLTFFGGLGILLYIGAWLVIPAQGSDEPVVGRWLSNLDMSDAGTIFGVVLVVAAVLIVLGQITNVSGTLIVALVLFVVGFLLYRGDLTTKRSEDSSDREPPSGGTMDNDTSYEPPESEASTPVAGAEVGGAEATATQTAPIVETTSKEQEPPTFEPPPQEPEVMWEPPPKAEPSILGRITLAVGLIVLAAMALIDLAFAEVSIAPVHYLAAAVAIAGIGLVVGGWVGRARWLIIIGVLLLPALWFTSFWPDNFSFSAGEVRYAPASVAEVATPYDLGMGQMTLDLSGMTAEELAEVGVIEASLGMGEMVVRLPTDVGAVIEADVGMGAVEGPFDQAAGLGVEVTRRVGPEPTTLVIRAEVGAGVVNVQVVSMDFDLESGGFEGSTS